jgi:hypothetical protein
VRLAGQVGIVMLAMGLAGCGVPGGEGSQTALARVAKPALVPVVDDVLDAAGGAADDATPPAGSFTPPTTAAAPPGRDPIPAVVAPEPTITTLPRATTTTSVPAPVPVVVSPPRAVPAGVGVYAGLGTWIDVYDWSRTFGGSGALVEVADIDRMADVGVQTLYVQTSRFNVAADILEPERLEPLIARARARGMAVVAWYLPTFVNPGDDLRRLVAAASLDVDAVAVDIESRDLADTAERNRRLVELSRSLRAALPGTALGAIVFPPVVMEVINTSFWPGFPWEGLAPFYDVWVPMAYQSFRTAASGYRDGGRYTAENIDRLRAHVPGAVVHTVGGIADETTPADVDAMVAAASRRGAIGGSLYDWRTTAPDLWSHLQAFRR